jgi:hypothetical protein
VDEMLPFTAVWIGSEAQREDGSLRQVGPPPEQSVRPFTDSVKDEICASIGTAAKTRLQ